MRKIFIDLGAYNGDSIQAFQRGELIPDPTGFEIYAIEANPKFKPVLEQIPSITFMPVAAWTEDGEVEFAVDPNALDLGSSLMRSKKVWTIGFKISVKCIDFSRWIRQFAGDEVVVKMDIEGAEFPILDKMLLEGTLGIIKTIFVEFHPNKVPEYSSIDKFHLMERVSLVTELRDWH